MTINPASGISVVESFHEAGEFIYPGDDHVYISLDTTVGVELTQQVGDKTTVGFTSPTAIHLLPPRAPSVWRHDRTIHQIQVRIDPALWERATGTDPDLLQPLACHRDPSSASLVRLLRDAWRSLDRESTPYLTSLLTTMALSVESGSHLRADATQPALGWVLDYIDDHIGETLDVTSLAAVAGVPRRTFQRQFAFAVGVSPYRYVIEARLDRARQLLEAGSTSISEVARLSGFFDQAHLTSTMRRYRGVTPGSLRATQT